MTVIDSKSSHMTYHQQSIYQIGRIHLSLLHILQDLRQLEHKYYYQVLRKSLDQDLQTIQLLAVSLIGGYLILIPLEIHSMELRLSHQNHLLRMQENQQLSITSHYQDQTIVLQFLQKFLSMENSYWMFRKSYLVLFTNQMILVIKH